MTVTEELGDRRAPLVPGFAVDRPSLVERLERATRKRVGDRGAAIERAEEVGLL